LLNVKARLRNRLSVLKVLLLVISLISTLGIGGARQGLAAEMTRDAGIEQQEVSGSNNVDNSAEAASNEGQSQSSDKYDVEADIAFLIEELIKADQRSDAEIDEMIANDFGPEDDLVEIYLAEQEIFSPVVDGIAPFEERLIKLITEAANLVGNCQTNECASPEQCKALQESRILILQLDAQLQQLMPPLLLRILGNTNFIAIQDRRIGLTGQAREDTRKLSDFVGSLQLLPQFLGPLKDGFDNCLKQQNCEPFQGKIPVKTPADFVGRPQAAGDPVETTISNDVLLARMFDEVVHLTNELEGSLERLKAVEAKQAEICPPDSDFTRPSPKEVSAGSPTLPSLMVASDSSTFCEFREGNPSEAIVRVPGSTVPPGTSRNPQPPTTAGQPSSESGPPKLATGERAPCEDLPALLALTIKLQAIIDNPDAFRIARQFAQSNLNATQRRIDELKKICPRPANKPLTVLAPCEEVELLAALRRESLRRATDLSLSVQQRAEATNEAERLERRIGRIRDDCPGGLAGTTRPPTGETRPFPVPEPGQAFLPIPAGLDPCVELDLLRVGRKNAQRVVDGNDAGPVIVETARKRLSEIDARIAVLTPKCPAESSSTPTNQPPLNEEPSERPDPQMVVQVFVKASTSALERGEQAKEEIAGQRIKLFAPSTMNVALPMAGNPKLQDDHNKDPMQGTTDENGELRITARLNGLFGDSTTNDTRATDTSFVEGAARDPSTGAPILEIDIDTTKQDSRNVLVDGVPEIPDAISLLQPSVTRIGSKTLISFNFPGGSLEELEKIVREAFPNAIIEINLCRVKEPLAPKPKGHFTPVPPEAELRGASIDLSLSNLEQGQ